MARNRQRRAASERVHIGVALVILVLVAVGYYFWSRPTGIPDLVPELPTAPDSADRPAPIEAREPAETGPKYPVQAVPPLSPEQEAALEEPGRDVPLPPLDESDTTIEAEVEKRSGATSGPLADLLIMDSFIRHFVVTVDNLTRAKLPQKYRFTQPPEGRFAVTTTDDGDYQIAPANYRRYEPYIRFAEGFGTNNLISLYVRYYPLFQQAYEELGYPDRYFNDRLVEVIDHLLATPEVEYPVRLVRSRVFYEFADPELEQLSAGRKLILRTGPENTARIKAILRELRTALTTLTAVERSE